MAAKLYASTDGSLRGGSLGPVDGTTNYQTLLKQRQLHARLATSVAYHWVQLIPAWNFLLASVVTITVKCTTVKLRHGTDRWTDKQMYGLQHQLMPHLP